MNEHSNYHGWSEIVFTVDRGASDTVIGLNCLTSVPQIQGVVVQNGVKCECDNEAIIENLG